MDKRSLKRHKREVSRARKRVRLSEPDLRTPEQVRAAREASRPGAGRRNGPHARYRTPSAQDHAGRAEDSTPKGEAGS
jgi:hypothetical protein